MAPRALQELRSSKGLLSFPINIGFLAERTPLFAIRAACCRVSRPKSKRRMEALLDHPMCLFLVGDPYIPAHHLAAYTCRLLA